MEPSVAAKSRLRQPARRQAGYGCSARSALRGWLAAPGRPGPLSATPDSGPGAL